MDLVFHAPPLENTTSSAQQLKAPSKPGAPPSQAKMESAEAQEGGTNYVTAEGTALQPFLGRLSTFVYTW